MAKEKASFVLYADLVHMVEQLPDETAGKLLKTILDYVNDRNPEPHDLTLKIAFEPIKHQLKRDLKKWEKRAKRARENGKLGGRKGTQKNPEEPTGLIPNPENPDGPVSVNVTVSDTVSVNGKKDYSPPPLSEFLEYCKPIYKDAFVNYEYTLTSKYESWVEAGWKDGMGNKIKNWKTKIKNTIPHLKTGPIHIQITEKKLVR